MTDMTRILNAIEQGEEMLGGHTLVADDSGRLQPLRRNAIKYIK